MRVLHEQDGEQGFYLNFRRAQHALECKQKLTYKIFFRTVLCKWIQNIVANKM